MADILKNVTPSLGRGRFAWSVGTRPIAETEWLLVGDDATVMGEKDRLHLESLTEVVVSLPGQQECTDELLELVVQNLVSHHAPRFTRHRSAVTDNKLRRTIDLQTNPSLETVGLLVAEDFAVMRPTSAGWVMTAATICFTSRWNLRSKLGQTVTAIHDPVPGYRARLGSAVDTLFDRITDDQILVRSNWTLLDTAKLHLPSPASPSVDATAQPAWLRVERQTLRRLATSGAVVFGINTIVREVSKLTADNRKELSDAMAHAPKDIQRYKGWPIVEPGPAV